MQLASQSSTLAKCHLPANAAVPKSSSRKALVVRAFNSGSAGDKVGRWLQTPFDILAFGPRAGTGALLQFPQRIATLQTDIQHVMEIIQDPRPLDEKQSVLLKEFEDNLVQCLERGVEVESDVISNIKTVLPTEAANVLTSIIPEPPNRQAGMYTGAQDDSPLTPPSMGEMGLSMGTIDDAPAETYGKEDVQANQIASEMAEIRTAVAALKLALNTVRSNTDVTQTNVLRLSLMDARNQLKSRVQEVSPASQVEPSVAAAVREATILLDEVDASFF